MSESKPTQLSDALLSGGAIAAETAGPTQQPPAALGGAVGIGAGVGASVWVSGKQVNALWAINENRNSWIGVTGVGTQHCERDDCRIGIVRQFHPANTGDADPRGGRLRVFSKPDG